ncbi:MAG: trigger factor [Chloroflexi bacterium]|nr:trigger factor [Chloroflexota bacterium]
MKVTTERIPEAQIVLEVELDDERVAKSLNQAAKRLSQRYRIPGFRKGKAPRVIVEQTLGAEAVFEEAMERMIPNAYEQAIKDEGIEPIGPPEVDNIDRDPFRFRARLPMPPEIDLGPYREIARIEEPVVVSDDDLADAVLEVRRSHAVLEPVERPVELNDRLKADVRATINGQQALDQPDADFHVREGMVIGIPGVVDELVGLGLGEHTFAVDAPDDWDDEDVAGKTAVFTVTIKEIKKEILPDADDDLASEAGEVDSFEELRAKLREDLRTRAEERSLEDHNEALLQAVIGGASIEFPPLLAQNEIEHMLHEVARSIGQDPRELVQSQDPKVIQMRERMREEAAVRVRRGLVIEKVAEAESIEVGEDDIEAEFDRIAGNGPQAEQVRNMIDTPGGRAMTRRNLISARVIDRLSEIARENALAAEDVEEDTPADDDANAEAPDGAAPAADDPDAAGPEQADE